MRNYLLLLALAGARACNPGQTLSNSKKCCPDGTESPYYNGGVGYACCGEGLATPSEAENGRRSERRCPAAVPLFPPKRDTVNTELFLCFTFV